MGYKERFTMSGGKHRSKGRSLVRTRKVRSNAGKKRGPRKVSRKRRSNAGKSRGPYRIRCTTSGKLRKKRSNAGKKRKSKGWFW